MDNETIERQISEVVPENAPEIAENAALSEKNAEIDALKRELGECSERILNLNLTLSEAETKLALLMSGTAKEKLSEALVLTSILCKSGKTPEEAAAEIIAAYPHLKAVQRDIPHFSAGGSGESDGFSAVRRIFSAR